MGNRQTAAYFALIDILLMMNNMHKCSFLTLLGLKSLIVRFVLLKLLLA